MWVLTILVMEVDEDGKDRVGCVKQTSSIEFSGEKTCRDYAQALEQYSNVYTWAGPK